MSNNPICGLEEVKVPDGYFDKKVLRKGGMLVYKIRDIDDKGNKIKGKCLPAMKQSRGTKPYRLVLKVR